MEQVQRVCPAGHVTCVSIGISNKGQPERVVAVLPPVQLAFRANLGRVWAELH